MPKWQIRKRVGLWWVLSPTRDWTLGQHPSISFTPEHVLPDYVAAIRWASERKPHYRELGLAYNG